MRLSWGLAVAAVSVGVSGVPAWAQNILGQGPAWGGWEMSSTVHGDMARGMGVLAAGTGAYNEQTARAMAINADTAARWNQYLYLSQQEANRRYYQRLAGAQGQNRKAREAIAKRLREAPTAQDIARGDALNALLDDLEDPAYYTRALRAAQVKVGGALIRDIPFQYAAAAITTSVQQLTQDGPPPVLKDSPAFTAERDALRAAGAELRRQNEEAGAFDPATLTKAQELARAALAKVQATLPRNTPDRDKAERYLKALIGLFRMFETPAINLLLAGVEKRPDATLGDLLAFMGAFNLRFGAAKTPQQTQAYRQLYPLLQALRDQTMKGTSAPPSPEAPADTAAAPEAFGGLPLEQLDPGRK